MLAGYPRAKIAITWLTYELHPIVHMSEMASSFKTVCALFIFAVCAGTGYAIKCYQCDSLNNPKCGFKFEADESHLFDCSRIAPPRYLSNPVSVATGCMEKHVEFMPDQPGIIRSCFFGDVSNIVEGCMPSPVETFLKQVSCEVCKTNACNGSVALTPIAGAILLLIGLARIVA